MAAACAGPSPHPRFRCPPAGARRSAIWCRTRWSGSNGAGRSSPTYSYELEDPEYLKAKVTGTSQWAYRPDVDFVVIDVPSALEETVPLGSAVSAVKGQPAQIAIYRRPVEIRSKGRDERALLIHEVVVEQVAELLGLAPESVDPRYGQD